MKTPGRHSILIHLLPWLQPSLEFFQLHSILADAFFGGFSDHGSVGTSGTYPQHMALSMKNDGK